MPSQNQGDRLYRSYWITKFAASFAVAVAVINSITFLIELLPEGASSILKIFLILFNNQVLICAIFGLGYTIYWQFKELKNGINSLKVYAWFHGIIRYWLAFAIAVYGFAKILRIQFGVSYHVLDIPVGDLSGISLTWVYFGYSHTFAVIIGLLQIGGSALLLFRRTTLMGVVMLLPVMVNIVLINAFYAIGAGAFVNSVLFTVGLLILLLFRWDDLKALFFKVITDLPAIQSVTLKSVLKVLVLCCAFARIYYFSTRIHSSKLVGKWRVDLLIKNGDTLKTNDWQNNASLWTSVYIEREGNLWLCANPYCYDANRSQMKRYTYNSTKQNMQLIGMSGDTINARINLQSASQMQWQWTDKQNKITMQLSKIETKHFD